MYFVPGILNLYEDETLNWKNVKITSPKDPISYLISNLRRKRLKRERSILGKTVITGSVIKRGRFTTDKIDRFSFRVLLRI